MAVEVLSGKVFLVVTGASQGIGKQIAITFAHLLEKDSQVLLLARNLNGLKNTAAKFPKDLKVACESVDLSVATSDFLDGILKKHLGANGAKGFDRAVIVHNAASLGDVSKTTIDLTDFKEWQENFAVNVLSAIALNSVFMKIFNDETKVKRLVINMTSLCCIEPVKSMGIYGPAKAAKEMYFKVFALEFPQVNVINYLPGIVATDQLDEFVKNSSAADVRSQFGELRDQNNILTAEQTVDRLVVILREQKYKSGDQVFALEFPQVNVINYSPGPVGTDLFDKLINHSSAADIRTQFGKLRDQNNILTAEQTIDRLVVILGEQKYKSGDHVYYFHKL